MTQRTKENIKWLKDLILAKADHTDKDEHSRGAECLALLDKFEEVERQLTNGGFIQDRNGKSCKDGDRIKIVAYGKENTGTVSWIPETACFLLRSDDENLYNWYIDELKSSGNGYFEKIEEAVI